MGLWSETGGTPVKEQLTHKTLKVTLVVYIGKNRSNSFLDSRVVNIVFLQKVKPESKSFSMKLRDELPLEFRMRRFFFLVRPL